MKKWFFLASFIAAIFCSLFWTTLIIFVIVTGRFRSLGIRSVVLAAPLLFFIYGAREMFGYFKDARQDK
jgi:hypothetical protein